MDTEKDHVKPYTKKYAKNAFWAFFVLHISPDKQKLFPKIIFCLRGGELHAQAADPNSLYFSKSRKHAQRLIDRILPSVSPTYPHKMIHNNTWQERIHVSDYK